MVVVFLSRELLRSMKLHLATEDSTVGAVQNMQSHRISLRRHSKKHSFLMKMSLLVWLGIKPHSCRKVKKNLKQE